MHPSDAIALHDEINALRTVSACEHIVKLHEVCDEPDDTYLVLEYMEGGPLIDRLMERKKYTEFDAKEVVAKLLSSVSYCHKKRIANRNLKLENLLLVSVEVPKACGLDFLYRVSDDTFSLNPLLGRWQ
jgi:serine/threonine protein kinase